MKFVLLPALTFVLILALLMAAEALQIGGSNPIRFVVCGVAGSLLAQLAYELIARYLRRRRGVF